MSNDYTTNPIVIDTFGSDLDIGTLAFGLDVTPFHISKLVFSAPTTGDVIVVRDLAGDVVSKLNVEEGTSVPIVGGGDVSSTTNWVTDDVERDFNPAKITTGLKLTGSDQTVTSGGKLYIHI